MDLKQSFQKALVFEQKGHDIYKDAANKTKNPIVAKTFSYLADQELSHIADIKDYLETGQVEFKGESPDHSKEFFSMAAKEFSKKTKLSDDDLKAHEAGLQLEKESYNFYKGQYSSTKDAELKRFFKFMMEQENSHYELIQKAYEYIKNPAAFYAEEEKWMAEGG